MLLKQFLSQRMEMGESEWYAAPLSPEPACARADFDIEFVREQASLKALETAVCGCLRCPLGPTRSKFVFGQGNPRAGIMFIGEAPGAEEDRQGLPFVGKAGQLLTKMIDAIKFRREDVYIGNTVKCRPPENRVPDPQEINRCKPILDRQIELIQPKIMCALGRTAALALLGGVSPLGPLRGKIHSYHDVKLIVTYHPAALLRNPGYKHDTWEDLKFLRREYDGLEL